jgi:ABC-type Zn uptake system ZnuABC Zn-binding protein ZnuA
MKRLPTTRLVLALGLVVALLAGCRPAPSAFVEQSSKLAAVTLAPGARLKVMVTTSIVGDLVKNVGGERIELRVLLPVGTDPHGFEPTPSDVASLAESHVLFANGAGLEEFLAKMIANARGKVGVIYVSDGVTLLKGHEEEHEEKTAAEEEHPHAGGDPHTWTSPENATLFVQNIERALSTLDPAGAPIYRVNAESYTGQLQVLDEWVRQQIQRIPPEQRKLVSDHEAFGYYAARYGLEQVGFVFPGMSTLAEPSAAQLAALSDKIRTEGVKAVFVGADVNPSLAKAVAEGTGCKLVKLYHGSLGIPGSGVETYLDYMRYNTTAIVEALR